MEELKLCFVINYNQIWLELGQNNCFGIITNTISVSISRFVNNIKPIVAKVHLLTSISCDQKPLEFEYKERFLITCLRIKTNYVKNLIFYIIY